MEIISTKIGIADKFDIFMTGNEIYPVYGNYEHKDKLPIIIKKFAGLKMYWDCLEKAKITAGIIGGVVVLGSTYVVSNDYKSEYGYEFQPPLEFHAWVERDGHVIDLALPGVIKMGLEMCDEIGPYIIGRTPVIFASSKLPDYIKYKPYEYYIV